MDGIQKKKKQIKTNNIKLRCFVVGMVRTVTNNKGILYYVRIVIKLNILYILRT